MGCERDYIMSEILQNAVIKRLIIPALTCISGFFIPNIQTHSLINVSITDVNYLLITHKNMISSWQIKSRTGLQCGFITISLDAYWAISTTVSPLYVPHFGQTRWAMWYSPQVSQTTRWLRVSASCARRLLRRVVECLRFGSGPTSFTPRLIPVLMKSDDYKVPHEAMSR